jgi:hypothetical protein
VKHIHYDSATILTGDDVADAVIEYAAALSGGDRADTVAVPSVAPDGTLTTTKILIGPASELVVEDADDDVLETEDAEFVQRLRAAARTFGHSEPIHAAERAELDDPDQLDAAHDAGEQSPPGVDDEQARERAQGDQGDVPGSGARHRRDPSPDA